MEGLVVSVWTPLMIVAPEPEVQRESEDAWGTPMKGGHPKRVMSALHRIWHDMARCVLCEQNNVGQFGRN